VTVDEALAWADYTSGLFELKMFRGGHFYLTARREEIIARIVEVLTLR
jgi:surfactin synthase thioesterase subunit